MKPKSIIIATSLLVIGGLTSSFFISDVANALGELWFLSSNNVRPNVSTWGIQIPSLTNCNTIDTSATGVFSCGTDSIGTSNWQFIGPNAVRPTTTVGIIVNASSTFSQVLNLDNYLSFTATSTPTTPAANHISVYAETTQGHTKLVFLDDDGLMFTMNRDNVFTAKNTSGSTINKGQAVYITGSTGNVPNISLAKANSTSTLPGVGLATANISNNAFGEIMILGIISSIDTSAFATGDRVFVSPTTAGNLTNVRPAYSNFAQRMGSVMVSGVGNGSIYVTTAPFVGGEENWTASSAGFTAKSLTISANGSATTTIASGISTFAGGLISQASSTFNGSITALGGFNGNASTADALFVNPTDCTNQFANAIAASGNLTCASVVDAYVDFTALTLADFTNDADYFKWANATSTYLPLRGGTITDLAVTYGISAATSTITATSTAGSLAVGTSNLYVSQNGNVGIGTAGPGYKLTVSAGGGALTGGDWAVSSAGTATTTISSGVSTFAGGIISQASSTFVSNIDVNGNITISSSTASLYQPIWGSDDGLVLYLPFSEGMTSSSANIAYDRSPFGNDGTATNMPMPTRNATSGESGWATTTAKCKVGSCMSFDGVNDYVDAGNAASLNPSQITVEAWVKHSNDSTENEIIARWGSGNPYLIGVFSGNQLFAKFTVAGGENPIYDSVAFPNETWTHVAATWSSTAGGVLYKNGVSVGSANTNLGSLNTNSLKTEIGRLTGDNGYAFPGLLDEVRIYNRALGADEIRAHYLRGTGAGGAVLADKFRVIGTDNNIDFIVNSGDAGIGTSTPSTKLAIAGNIMGSGNMIVYGTTVTSTFSGGLSVGNNAALVVNQAASANSMYIATNGNVGIGTTTPTSLFTLSATGSLALPYGNPTVDNSGEIGINTDQASSSIRYYDGTAERAIFDVFEKSFWVASTTDDENNNSFNDATSTFTLWNPARRITLVGLYGKTDNGTVNFACGDGTNWTETIVATATGVEDDGSMMNNTFTQREDFQCKIGSAATVPSKVTITTEFRYEAD